MRSRRLSTDGGSGSVLTIAVLGSVTALAVMTLPLSVGFVARQAVAGAADAAALAAADTASGAVAGAGSGAGARAGSPCDSAARVAAANGAALNSCTVDGLVVTVTAQRVLLGIQVTAAATAGPAVTPPD